MIRVGITGHQRLQDPSRWAGVQEELEKVLDSLGQPVVGISSLAAGADQAFAEAVLKMGGVLECIVPFTGYERTFTAADDRARYLRLLRAAQRHVVLETAGSDEEAFWAAGRRVVDESDCVVAVWDGREAGGLGGTADVVAYAEARGKRVLRIDPGPSG